MVVNWHAFVNWRHLYVLHLIFILKQLWDLGVIFCHLLEFLLRNWAVLRPIENLENVFFRLQSLIYSLLLLGNWLGLLGVRLWSILVLGARGSLLHQCLFHLLTVVSDGVVQETLTSSVSNFQIHSKSDQPLENRELVAFDGIEHRSLLEIIDMVVFRPITFEELTHLYVS